MRLLIYMIAGKTRRAIVHAFYLKIELIEAVSDCSGRGKRNNRTRRLGPRNSFRAANRLEIDLALDKPFAFTERRNIVRFLESPSFGQATDTVTPGRRVQLALKYNF